jgi:hypothetical protein
MVESIAKSAAISREFFNRIAEQETFTAIRLNFRFYLRWRASLITCQFMDNPTADPV